ncbi:MAG TPA: CehA/McbA family metallohydrolase [Ktedonobacterales bacterium]
MEPSSAMPDAATGWSRADVHMHTNLGDGTASPERVLHEARHRGLRVIAVTDHDHLEGAKRVQEILDREGATDIELVWGCEVTTRQGHFLGLFMRKPVKFLSHVEDAIDAIKAQGGITVVPHPMGRLVPSLSRRKIEELLSKGYALDAIEIYNPSPANSAQRKTVATLNQTEWKLAETGGSDAHFWQHIGAGYTSFDGATADDLRRALLSRTARPGGQEARPERLPISAYVLQNVWSLGIDPPRKLLRMWRARGEGVGEQPAEAPQAHASPHW